MIERRRDYPELIKHLEKNGDDLVSLRDFMEEKCNGCQEAVNQKFLSLEKATDLANDNLRIHLASLNEWRLQNKDERETYLTKEIYEARHQLLEAKIDSFQRFMYMAMGAIVALEFLFRFILK